MLPGITLQAMVLVGTCNIGKKMKSLIRRIKEIKLRPQRGCPGLGGNTTGGVWGGCGF